MTRLFGAPVSSRGHRVVAGLVVWSLALPTHAAPSDAAAPEGQTDVLLEQAADAYDRADFEASIAAFEAAYALEGDPACLFNIGRVHEEAGQLRRALERYQEFILQPQSRSRTVRWRTRGSGSCELFSRTSRRPPLIPRPSLPSARRVRMRSRRRPATP